METCHNQYNHMSTEHHLVYLCVLLSAGHGAEVPGVPRLGPRLVAGVGLPVLPHGAGSSAG